MSYPSVFAAGFITSLSAKKALCEGGDETNLDEQANHRFKSGQCRDRAGKRERKDLLRLSHLAQRAVDGLNGIGRGNDAPNHLREHSQRDHSIPFLRKHLQLEFRLICCSC